MKFAEAITAAIDEEYARRLDIHAKLGLDKAGLTPCTRDEVAAGDKDIRIAMDVMGECGLADEFYKEEHLLDFGTFYNCREYGVTVTVGGWTFASFEHRNSDAIMVDGCRVEDVKEYGPYSTDDKWDSIMRSAPKATMRWSV
jgi:hypothetical protein